MTALVVWVFILFSIWSSSFIAMELLLLGRAGGTGSDSSVLFSPLGLTAARFGIVTAVVGVYCFGFHAKQSLDIIRERWGRLVLCGTLNVACYNLAMYYAIHEGVASPVASMITALSPLFMMLLSAAFLGEKITARRLIGFGVAMSGVVVIALSKPGGGATYPLLIAILACAPLAWSGYSALTKPVAKQYPPLLWTYLVLVAGGLPTLFVLPFEGWHELVVLEPLQWAALGHLSLLSTVLCFAIWTWLLKHLPATTVGFTVFLNPPMTTGYKALLAALFPAVFVYTIEAGEYAGGAVVLAGVAIATLRLRRAL